MNIAFLSFKSLISKPLTSALSWLLLTFGVCVVLLILLVSQQLKSEISRNAAGIDLVVGSKGSPLQLILSSIFHIDFPTGNISLSQAEKLSKNRFVESIVPLSLGDSYKGYRIVGTNEKYAALYNASIDQGAWASSDLGAVIGAEVAKELSLGIGDHFSSQHGLDEAGDDHEGHEFTVSGIMKQGNTVLDRLILVSTRSVWLVHEHEDEHEHHGMDSLIYLEKLGLQVTQEELSEESITSVLISYRSPMAAVMLPRVVNGMADLQAASPAYETARLFNLIGTGVKVLNVLGLAVVIISGISIFIALLNSLKERKYEIAIMRSMGATQFSIFLHVVIEGLLLAFLGALSGLVFAHGGLWLVSQSIEGVTLSPTLFVESEWLVVVGALLLGLVASIFPAIFALRTDISTTLSKA